MFQSGGEGGCCGGDETSDGTGDKGLSYELIVAKEKGVFSKE